MIRDSKTDILCLAAAGTAILIAIALIVGCLLFAKPAAPEEAQNTALSTDYADRIFDDSYVHEINILLPELNWDYMVKFALDEQYVICDLEIDGERIENAAIRPKGNSSLSAIKTQGSDRFSFKIEFDHYRANNTYYGLDKLALNNLGQDVSCMKDYLTYHMMNEMGLAAPLSSYVHLKLNGEDFGLYLAVEAIEDSFALRNYGSRPGNLYKPECFAIATVTPSAFINTDDSFMYKDYSTLGPGDRFDILGAAIRSPFEKAFGENMEVAALKYVGDDPERYRVFFDSAVFDITEADKLSLIGAFEKLNSGADPAGAADMDSVIDYFVVHNFVNNYDGYTGIFVHNYYLRECDGKISMIPWDYNLGFGIFTFESAAASFLGDSAYEVDLQIGEAMDDGTGMVNYPIDEPTFTVSVEDRPLLAAVLNNEKYLEKYHARFEEFLETYFESGKFEQEYAKIRALISPYVAKGQTFYTYEHFEKAADAVHEYCDLREQSIRGQLGGTIPATMEGQSRDYENLVDASALRLSDSVTFDALVFGIRSEDVLQIMDAIAGDHPHNTEGMTAAVAEMGEDPSLIPKVIGRVIASSDLLKKAIGSAVAGPLLLILSVVVLIVVFKRVRKYKRRKNMNAESKVGGEKHAIPT